MRRLLVFTALLGGSCANEPAEQVRASGQAAAILEGADAAHRTGVVHIEHALSGERCSGALVAPDLVLTAAHCAFSRDDLATEPLPADGFRVGFGSSTDELDIA